MIPQRRMLRSQPMRGLRTGLAVFVCAVAALVISVGAQPPQYDLLLRNGHIVDGTGSPWFKGDVAIGGDAIVRIAPAIEGPAARVIDVGGAVVAPGFIDIHTHARRGLLDVPTAPNYVRQGVTTVMEGPDGSSPLPIATFLAQLERLGKSLNIGTFVGQGLGSRRGHRPRQPDGHAAGDPEDGRPRRAGHEGRRVRPEHRSLLRAGDLHADRRGHRARARRRHASAACTSPISATMRRRCSTACERRSRSASAAGCRRRSATRRSSVRRTGARASTCCGSSTTRAHAAWT